MSFGIFKEIERLVEYIPIETHAEGIGRLLKNADMDTQFYFKDLDGIAVRLGVLDVGKNTISVRNIVKLLNKFFYDTKRIFLWNRRWQPVPNLFRDRTAFIVPA